MESKVHKLDRISYSYLQDWQKCAYYFKLVHILKNPVFESSVHTCWGRLIHKYLQKALIENKADTTGLIKTWLRFCRLYKLSEHYGWARSGAKAVLSIRELMKLEFGEFEVFNIEERLFLPIDDLEYKFKGFIDVVLKTNDKIILIDFKTCNSTYLFNKYRDKYKDYQLSLYKQFYSIKHDIEPKAIDTYFVTIERPERASKPVKFIRVTSGPRKLKNASAWLYEALRNIENEIWIKNRTSCLKYGEDNPCKFYETGLCSK